MIHAMCAMKHAVSIDSFSKLNPAQSKKKNPQN